MGKKGAFDEAPFFFTGDKLFNKYILFESDNKWIEITEQKK